MCRACHGPASRYPAHAISPRREQRLQSGCRRGAFNAGLAVALAEGREMRVAVRFANAVASLAVTRRGAVAAMPTREKVDAFLETRAGA